MPQRRRNIIFWIFGGGFIGSLISFLYPVIRFLNPPAVSEASVNEVADGKVQDLTPNRHVHDSAHAAGRVDRRLERGAVVASPVALRAEVPDVEGGEPRTRLLGGVAGPGQRESSFGGAEGHTEGGLEDSPAAQPVIHDCPWWPHATAAGTACRWSKPLYPRRNVPVPTAGQQQ